MLSPIFSRRLTRLCLLALAAGCGGKPGAVADDDAGPPGAQSAPVTPAVLANTLPPFALATPESFYRLDLARAADGTVSLSGASLVELQQFPLPALSADYVVVGYAGAQVVSAVPVAFPDTMQSMGWSGAAPVHQTVSLADSVASVFVEAAPGLDQIAVLAADGTVKLALTGAALPAPTSNNRLQPQAGPPLGKTQEPIAREQLAFRYAHIHFLQAGDDKLLPSALLNGGIVISPTGAMNDTIANGIAKLAPGTLSAVQTLGVVRWPAGSTDATSTLGMALGASLVLNADLMQDPEMELTIVHEIAHSFTFLSNAAATAQTKDLSMWPDFVQNAALDTVKRFRLVKGLSDVWRQLHESGLKGGFTQPYTGSGPAWMSLADADARAQGFASPYGSTSEWEDLAEYVGSVQSPSASTPGACPLFAGGGQLVPAVAIPYAKLVLLLGVGAISDMAFNTCVQGKTIAQQAGIQFPGSISFDTQPHAGYLTEDGGGNSYGVMANGPNSYQLLLEVAVDSASSSPLGLHRLDNIWLGNIRSNGVSGAYLGNDDSLLARVGEQGLVLFTEASTQRTAGAVFGLVLENAAGLNTDSFPFGSFRIP
jgi:hypothetical protein